MAGEEKEEAEQPAEPAPASGGGGATSKIVIVSSLVNMAATVGIVAVLVSSHRKEAAKPTVEDVVAGKVAEGKGHGEAKGEHGGHEDAKGAEESVTDAGKIMPLEPFTVNLSSGIGTNPRYVRMNVAMELEQGVPDKEFEIKLPRVRDTIINLLNSKKATDVNAVDGREQLKEEIRRSVNAFLVQSKVKGVYFTNFAISN